MYVQIKQMSSSGLRLMCVDSDPFFVLDVSEVPRRAALEAAASSGSTPTCAGRGRVAQLMKNFSVESPAAQTQSPARSIKPPLPTKPSHLRLTTTPTVR